jgi:antitoxin CcdA
MRTVCIDMSNPMSPSSAKRPVKLLLSDGNLVQARLYAANLSVAVDGLLAEFVARERQVRQDQQQHYAEVSGAWNRFEEAHGSLAEEYSTL